MTNDQLLKLAGESGTLLPEARDALNGELRNRKLAAPEIEKWAEEARQWSLEEIRRKPLARMYHGFGTMLCGKRLF